MKNKKIVVLLLTLVLTLGLSPMSVFAEQRAVTEDSKASITVDNAVENDELAVYKVVDITYDANTNHLTYSWNSAFEEYFEGTTNYNSTAYTVEQFATLEDNSNDLKTLLAQLPNYIADRTISPLKTETVGEDGTATFTELEMGEYFILPISSTSVYQLMLQKIEPTVGNTSYVIDDVTFTAKNEKIDITKTADKTSVTKNENVNYTITVDIPTYSTEATDKSFYISDLLSDGLALDTTTIKVQIDNSNVKTDAYTLDITPTNDYTFKLSVDTTQYDASWTTYNGKKLVITYSATLNSDSTTEVNVKETNEATFNYSNYPYVENSHENKTTTYDVNTFAIKIDKYAVNATNKDDKTKKLANAKFDLYRIATQEEIDAKKSVTIPHTDIQGILLESDIVTNDKGEATFEKYEANDENYNYYLVETQAPNGYNLLKEAVIVNFSDTDVEKTNGVYTVEVPNNSGIILPITGGDGIVLFTVIGIIFMSGAVFLFIISHKKSKANYKK